MNRLLNTSFIRNGDNALRTGGSAVIARLGSAAVVFQMIYWWVTAKHERAHNQELQKAIGSGIVKGKAADIVRAGEDIETTCNARRTRLVATAALWLMACAGGSLWWQYTNNDAWALTAVGYTAVAYIVISGVVSKETGAAVDTAITAAGAVAVIAVMWWTAPTFAMVFVAAPIVTLTAAGVIIGPGHNRNGGMYDKTSEPVEIKLVNFGDATESAIAAGITAAAPEVAALVRKFNEQVTAGLVPPAVFKPFFATKGPNGVVSAVVPLPGQKTVVSTIVDNAEAFAKAVGVPTEWVVLSKHEGKTGELSVTVLPCDPASLPQPRWAHLDDRVISESSICVGYNANDRCAMIPHDEGADWFVGGQKGSGKSNALRVMTAAWAMQYNGRARLHIFNMKGGQDIMPFRHVAHTFGNGNSDEVIAQLLATLEWYVDEFEQRQTLMESFANAGDYNEFPDSRIDSRHLVKHELFADRLIIDEYDIATKHPVYGDDIKRLLGVVAEKMRSGNMRLGLFTQRNVGKDMSDTINQIDVRLAGYLADSSDIVSVLGESWNGPSPRQFRYESGPKEGRPIPGMFAVRGGTTDLCRVPELTAEICDKLMVEERQRRQAAGLLTGMAAGDNPFPDGTPNDADAILRHWPRDADGVTYDVISTAEANNIFNVHVNPSGVKQTQTATTQRLTALGVPTVKDFPRGDRDVNKRSCVRHSDVTQAAMASDAELVGMVA